MNELVDVTPEEVCPKPCVEVTIEDMTTGTLDGTGVFDKLMYTVRLHLIREHDAGRITGASFTEAYIASMQAVLGTSVQFALGKDRIGYELSNLWQQRELTEEQLALIRAQTAQVILQTDILDKNQDLNLLR